ncbi:MAG TPA: hypothetical protein VK638_30435, partial [Edaphobacter sp.]|nr:hypothetical protein [Edaphobacter sp.]
MMLSVTKAARRALIEWRLVLRDSCRRMIGKVGRLKEQLIQFLSVKVAPSRHHTGNSFSVSDVLQRVRFQ